MDKDMTRVPRRGNPNDEWMHEEMLYVTNSQKCTYLHWWDCGKQEASFIPGRKESGTVIPESKLAVLYEMKCAMTLWPVIQL